MPLHYADTSAAFAAGMRCRYLPACHLCLMPPFFHAWLRYATDSRYATLIERAAGAGDMLQVTLLLLSDADGALMLPLTR